jgi:hypothetical protein
VQLANPEVFKGSSPIKLLLKLSAFEDVGFRRWALESPQQHRSFANVPALRSLVETRERDRDSAEAVRIIAWAVPEHQIDVPQ